MDKPDILLHNKQHQNFVCRGSYGMPIWGPYGMYAQGIKTGPVKCKASAISAVLSLLPLPSNSLVLALNQ